MTQSRFDILNRERTLLILDLLEAETAAHIQPHDEDLQSLAEAQGRALDEWNRLHAAEYNQLKPWYRARAGKMVNAQ